MKYTANLNLNKPDGTDVVDVQNFNDNADIIDLEITKKATQSQDGRMSKEDKEKLDGIDASANNYQHPSSHSADMITETSTKKIMTDSERTKLDGIESGANKYVHPSSHTASTITQDSTHRFVTDTEKSTWNNKASKSVATTSTDGLMSSSDKTKLDGIASNANNYSHPSTHPGSMITQDSSHRFVSDSEKASWDAKPSSQRAVSDSVTSTSTTTAASSKAVKTAYDKGVSAYNLANGKLGASSKAVDSDKLDGLDSSQFLRSDTDDNISCNLEFQDSKQLRFGNDADYRIWHDGTNNYHRSYKHGAATYFQGENASGSNKNMIYYDPDNKVGLYYAGSLKFETTSSGGKVSGDLEITGDVTVGGSKVATESSIDSIIWSSILK